MPTDSGDGKRDVMNTAIIVAGGSSRRMGFNKLLAPLAGREVLLRAIEVFESLGEIDEIIVVSGAETLEACGKWSRSGNLKKLSHVVEGGAQRHLSVSKGLDLLRPSAGDLVAVHDGARPLVSPGLIVACLGQAAKTGAAACAHRITDTVKRADADGLVTGSVERENLWAMETPQVFSAEVLLEVYAEIINRGELVTDEVSAFAIAGHPVSLVENTSPNPKITFPADLAMAERLLGFAS